MHNSHATDLPSGVEVNNEPISATCLHLLPCPKINFSKEIILFIRHRAERLVFTLHLHNDRVRFLVRIVTCKPQLRAEELRDARAYFQVHHTLTSKLGLLPQFKL